MNRSMTRAALAACIGLAVTMLGPVPSSVADDDQSAASERGSPGGGLTRRARRELRLAGVTKYLGDFAPSVSASFADVWTQHTFDPDNGDGPICIDGTPYSMFTKPGDPEKLLIFFQGGGACWEGFEQCNRTAEAQFPPPAAFAPGVFAATSPDGTIDNPLSDYSVAFFPYCDGSVFTGDNATPNTNPDSVSPSDTLHYRGLRNATAGLDVARDVFPEADTILIAGSSAGGVGAAGFAPFLTRFLWGDRTDLYVFNDAGPLALNPEGAPDAALARAETWRFDEFFPLSCVIVGLCDPEGQQTGLVEWRLRNDRTIREAFYTTDADLTNLGFVQANVPGNPPFVPVTQAEYRAILDAAHGRINAKFPGRYKRFLISGANESCPPAFPGGPSLTAYTHTALVGPFGEGLCPGSNSFFGFTVDDTLLSDWTNDFVTSIEEERRVFRDYVKFKKGKISFSELWDSIREKEANVWDDIVEPFATAPPLPTAP